MGERCDGLNGFIRNILFYFFPELQLIQAYVRKSSPMTETLFHFILCFFYRCSELRERFKHIVERKDEELKDMKTRYI